jgi:hypothetical protein
MKSLRIGFCGPCAPFCHHPVDISLAERLASNALRQGLVVCSSSSNAQQCSEAAEDHTHLFTRLVSNVLRQKAILSSAAVASKARAQQRGSR